MKCTRGDWTVQLPFTILSTCWSYYEMKENYMFYLLSLFLSPFFVSVCGSLTHQTATIWNRVSRHQAAQVFHSHSRQMSLRVQTVFIGPNDVNSSWQSLSAFKEMLQPINQGRRKVSCLTEVHVIRAYRGCASKVRRILTDGKRSMEHEEWMRKKESRIGSSERQFVLRGNRSGLLLWRFRGSDRSSFRYRYRIKRWEVRGLGNWLILL